MQKLFEAINILSVLVALTGVYMCWKPPKRFENISALYDRW